MGWECFFSAAVSWRAAGSTILAAAASPLHTSANSSDWAARGHSALAAYAAAADAGANWESCKQQNLEAREKCSCNWRWFWVCKGKGNC
jgi:hypothetical protein